MNGQDTRSAQAQGRADRIRVLVVDDSAIARDLLERGLSLDPGIEVVGKASDVYSARDKIVYLHPDVVTLDVEMPKMNGIEFLRRLMPQYPVPVVVVSAVTGEGSAHALEALEAGAVGVVAKPDGNDRAGLEAMLADLTDRVKEAATVEVSRLKRVVAQKTAAAPRPSPVHVLRPASIASSWYSTKRLIAIGASTGGTYALGQIIPRLPADMPPIMIVQHMPPGFTKMFADALNKQSEIEVKEAEEGDELKPGLALVAPGDLHLKLVSRDGKWKASCVPGPKVSGHRPSVDVLFESVSKVARESALGVLLTGMGRDGADGLLAMRRNGARALAQDEASSVVFGMPMEAWKNGGAERLVPLESIADEISVIGRQLQGMGAR